MADSPEHLHRTFQDAFNRHDLESVVALYEPRAVLVSRDGPVEGTDAIRQRYRDVLVLQPSIAVRTLSVHRSGALAMLHGKWTMRLTAANGQDVQTEGRNTETVRQQSDGRWLFVIDNPSVPQD